MQCEACKETNPESNRFCQACGAALAVVCPGCGNTCPPVAAFCGACGVALEARSPVTAPRVVSRRAPVLRGELKQVTVLFADLVSSTELVAQLDAEEAMVRLRPALNAMCDAVERFDGTVVRTLGDGIMAMFGAPRAQENHALLASQAALAIRDRFQDGPLSIRIGLHSGEVVADARLTEPNAEPGAYGLALHLGSRLPPMAEPGSICISEWSYRLIRSFCDAEPMGRHTLRGVPEPVDLYELKGLKPAVASQQFRGVALTPFRGRERETALLRRALVAVSGGSGRVVGVAGEPGSGKSRLCYEFAEWCRGQQIPVYEARAQPFSAATPLQPVLEFLRSSWFNIAPADAPADAARAIADSLAEIGAEFSTDLVLVCDFLGVPYAERPPPWISARARIARLLDIVRQLFRQRGAKTSVILIEDLHWLDEASSEFVAMLAETAAETRSLVLVNYRPGYAARWMDAASFQQIALDELSPTETDRLLDELLGSHPEIDDIRQRIAERSGGNPFFAEELVRSLADRAVLLGRPGNYRRGLALDGAVLPPTVQAVIGARIDRLNEPDCALLQIGSILGKEFQLALLRHVAGQPAPSVDASLERLCNAGLLHPRSTPDGPGYGFRHPLIQEVAYASQLKTTRSVSHAAVARAIEQFFQDRPNEFAALLAHHYEEAGEVLNAAVHGARAARWIGRTSPAQAIRQWRKVRSLLSSQPRSPDTDPLRIETSSQIAWLGWREGLTSEEAQPLIQEALDWAREADNSMIPMLLFVQGRIAMSSGGSVDDYARLVRQALSLTDPVRDASHVATLNAALSQALGWAGLLREALAANDAALAGAGSVTDFDHQLLGYSVENWALSLRGRLLLRLGDLDAARESLEHMLHVEDSIDPTVRFVAHFGHIDLAWCLDDAAMAAEHAAAIAAMARWHGSAYLRLYAMAGQAFALAVAREYERAIEAFQAAIAFLRESRAAMEFEPEMLASMAECLWRTGAPDQAIAVARDAVAVSRQRDARLPECRASITLGAALLQVRGDRAEAVELLDYAAALIQVTGARIYDRPLGEARAIKAAAFSEPETCAPAR